MCVCVNMCVSLSVYVCRFVCVSVCVGEWDAYNLHHDFYHLLNVLTYYCSSYLCLSPNIRYNLHAGVSVNNHLFIQVYV